jgi:phosphatidate phosphatase PAH1
MNILDATKNAGDTTSGEQGSEENVQSSTAVQNSGNTSPSSGSNAKENAKKGVDRLLRINRELRSDVDGERAKRIAAEQEIERLRSGEDSPPQVDVSKLLDQKFAEIDSKLRDRNEFDHLMATYPDARELLPDMEIIRRHNPNLSQEAVYILAKNAMYGDQASVSGSQSLHGRAGGDVTASTPNGINSLEDLDAIKKLPPSKEKQSKLEAFILANDL